ncbi:LysR family transcriptional regulator [Galactobacter sp.]|uniref:LysR family transcriptional regulator n=1 Tax=Galactobacter sp. TaxID=2676125 RepID=UPI0025B947E4|nr:LysR family transcriptional regulator [Galactobacter sp.]
MTSSDDHVFTPATLRLLVAVQEHGSIGAAARSQGLTQPQASRTLKAVERHLGCELVARSPAGSKLTAAGTTLCSEAKAVLRSLDRFTATASALADPGPPRLDFAASRTVGEHLVPGWLGAWAAARPDVWVSTRFNNSTGVIDWVRDGAIPLGFIEDPEPPDDLANEQLGRDRLAVIVRPGHAWQDAVVGPSDLAGTGLVEREEGSGTRATLDAVLPQRHRPVAVLDSNAAIVRAVAAGVGPAVLSEMAVRQPVADAAVGLARWQGQPLSRGLHAIWRQDVLVPEPTAAFLDLVRSLAVGT